MSKVEHGVFELGGYQPTGECIEAHWTVDDNGTVILTDQDGTPVRNAWGDVVSEKVTGGQIIHPRVIAARLATRHHRTTSDGMEGFRRPLSGRDYEKVPC